MAENKPQDKENKGHAEQMDMRHTHQCVQGVRLPTIFRAGIKAIGMGITLHPIGMFRNYRLWDLFPATICTVFYRFPGDVGVFLPRWSPNGFVV